MKIIGLTGNAGSGKSTALDFFRSKGINGVSTDTINADIRRHSKFITIVIESALQENISDDNGFINPGKLREVVFSSASSQHQVERILHPLIMENVDLQLALLPQKNYCLIEIPLLFEAKLLIHVDSVLLVTTNRAIQAKRLNTRSQLTQDKVEAILDSQLADNNKFPQSDDIVLNNDTQEAFQQCLDQLHHRNFQ